MQSVSKNSFHLHKARIMSATLDLPDHFEVVILGTGLVESIVAAAAARLGHTVLHIDTAGYYGGDFASFTLEGVEGWIKTENSDPDTAKNNVELDLNEGEELVPLGSAKTIQDIRQAWHVGDSNKEPVKESDTCNENAPENSQKQEAKITQDQKENSEAQHENSQQQQAENQESSESNNDDQPGNQDKPEDEPNVQQAKVVKVEDEAWTKERLLRESRRFNLDLAPRLLYARGSMVELLISSNISRYTEFKAITRVLTQIGGRLEHVPSSRADVFGTRHISVVEKRILMKFLSMCSSTSSAAGEDGEPQQESTGFKGGLDKPFKDFLKQQNLTDNLTHFVIHSIAMVKSDTGAREGLEQTKKFLSSLGRFGSTPFLWSMYGTGELPQAFCRLCAVYGGVYYLGRELNNLIVKEGRCVGIVTGGKRINCDFLVLPDKNLPNRVAHDDLQQSKSRRLMYITSSSILPTEKEQITLLSLPVEEPCHVVEVGPGTAACPRGLHVLHATAKDSGVDIADLLKDVVSDPSILYSLSYTQVTTTGDVGSKLSNVFWSSGPLPELDFDESVLQAQQIYSRLFPGEEFLPRAPDPEEIIIGEDPENSDTKTETNDDKGDNNESKTKNNDDETENKTDNKTNAENIDEQIVTNENKTKLEENENGNNDD